MTENMEYVSTPTPILTHNSFIFLFRATFQITWPIPTKIDKDID